MIESVEVITFNGVNLVEEFSDAPGTYFIVNDVRGRGVMSEETSLIRVPGMPGAHLAEKRVRERPLEVDITMKGESFEDLRRRIERLSTILRTEDVVPITFADETDRTYYGTLENVVHRLEDSLIYKATLTFVCPDPYKYGPELPKTFPADSAIIENPGTAEADPVFELTAKENTTFAMISTEDQYNLVGVPADDDVQVVDTKTSVLYENGSTIDTWQPASLDMVDTNFIDSVDGVMGTDGAGIRAENYGTPGERQGGPAVFKELTEAIQDFEIESTFDIISRREIENWRMIIYFHDENMNNLGHLGLKDNSRYNRRRVPLGRYGHYRGGGLSNGNLIGDADTFDGAREVTLFYLRVRREKGVFSFYIGEWQNQRHVRNWEGKYHDVNNQWSGPLKYITLFIGRWQDRIIPSRLRMNSVEVFELSRAEEDQTPYILYEGDTVTFDHANDEILINGEDAMPDKDFGGEFFKLSRGLNTVTVMPDGAFDTKVRFRPRYR